MVHVLEHPQFPVGPLGVDGGLEGPRQLLDGDFQVASILLQCLGVGGAADLLGKERANSKIMLHACDLEVGHVGMTAWHLDCPAASITYLHP